MANRSYLYSCDHIPGETEDKAPLKGISEWKYDIPLTYKILLSCNPRICRSSIWEIDKNIAIVADYDSGVQKLIQFLDHVESPESANLVAEAKAFLQSTDNKGRYFVLECGEIFDMEDEDLEAQNNKLFAELSDLQPLIDEAIVMCRPKKPKGLLSKIFGRNKKEASQFSLAPYYFLGLGNWSNILYFDVKNRWSTE
jgi:hypothetical protein